jgi:hypothetical protein
MNKLANILVAIDNNELTVSELSSILEMVCTKIDINTISGMARSEGKTPRGIRISNQYKKTNIGCQLMAINGAKESSLPF